MRSCLAAVCCTDDDFEQTHTNDSGCDYFKALCAKNEAVYCNVIQNAIRDGVWTFFSDKDLNLLLQPTTRVFSGNSQWAGQETYSVLAMCAVSFIGAGIYSRYGINRPFPISEALSIVLSASASVYAWDRGQAFGQTLFQNMGYSTNQAGYLSSIFAGLSDAPAQFVLFKFVKLMANSVEYSAFRQNPKSYLCDFFAGLGFSATVGVIPGAVWQLIFNALMINNVNAILASVAVMLAVLLCNYAYIKFAEKMIESDCYKNGCFDWCGREKNFSAQTETTHEACCVSLYHFFTTSYHNESSAVIETRLAENFIPHTMEDGDSASTLETKSDTND